MTTTENKNGPEVLEHLEANAHNTPAGDLMNKLNSTVSLRRRNARKQGARMRRRIFAVARQQHIGVIRLAKQSSVPIRRVLVASLGFDVVAADAMRLGRTLNLTVADLFDGTEFDGTEGHGVSA